MTFRSSLLSITLLSAAAPASISGFVAPSSTSVCNNNNHPSSATTALSGTSSRRDFFEQSTSSIIIAGATFLSPQVALAKEAPPPPLTKELVTTTFDAVRNELTSPTGVVSTLGELIDNGSFEDIMEYTKEQDAYFRKAKMGRARKLLTDKDLKGEAVQMSNAVTFDLIGINRASRPGQRDKDVQSRYLEELKKDIEKFLELEGTIVIPPAE